MKLLRVKATNFKACADDYTIDLIAHSKKTSEDRLYELQEVAPNLFTFNTAAIAGKNASGKSSALELLDWAYAILGDFRLDREHSSYENVKLEIVFFHEDFIFRYRTTLASDPTLGKMAVFKEQTLEQKPYYKSYASAIYDDNGFSPVSFSGTLPEDTSIVFHVLHRRTRYALYYGSEDMGTATYPFLFRLLKTYAISPLLLSRVLHLFDANIASLEMIDERHYALHSGNEVKDISDLELLHLLSSGTTKGALLYIMAIASLQHGIDLLVDEIENHFHKTLVDNLINLYKDPLVNKKHATLIFSTHYCELLDHFNRQDNVWIAQSGNRVTLKNVYLHYNDRPVLLKSQRFYKNAFDTAVDYDALMRLKAGLMQ